MDSVRQNRTLAMRLSRSLSPLETWSFGLTGNVCWIGSAPILYAALGSQAIFVWLPGVIVSILLNLQVQQLGRYWPEVAGGTPNYAVRLLKNFPRLGRYLAIGYYIGWVAAPALYASILVDLIQVHLEPLSITCPKTILKIGFVALTFVVGFSGTRALSLLHLFFVIPAITILLAFCFQGLGWLAFSNTSPGLIPNHWTSLSFGEWAKWFFIATYSVYSCETATSFVADSRRPSETLRFLSFAAWLIPPVFIGGSWVLMQLATQPGTSDNVYLLLLGSAQPFWGQSASFLVTLLIAFDCLLSCATAVSNTPRILYQFALDGHLAPVFTVVSRRGVLEPALILTFILSLFCLAWDLSHIFIMAGTGYLLSIMGVHLGLCLRWDRPEVRWPGWSLCFFIVEAVVLIVGGLAWGWQDLLGGLLFPVVVLTVDAAIRRVSFPSFHPNWWIQRYHTQSNDKIQDFVVLQVFVLILLICSAATVGWVISGKLDRTSGEPSAELLAVLLVVLSFIGVAIACWTTLPQIAAIDEAREQAKNLLITTLDTVPDSVLILDENGKIRQINVAAEKLFQVSTQYLVGHYLHELLTDLADTPEQWLSRSEHTLKANYCSRIIESSISQQPNHKVQEYIVLLRDITKRKQTEEELSQHRSHLEELVKQRTIELSRVNKQLQRDISERKRAEEQLLHNTLHDELTGLPNQALFMDRLQLAVERAKRRHDYLFAVLFLDLDRFKVVNDSLGHMVGNQLLIAISRRLEVVMRSVDTVARFGGDEFTILLEDIEDLNATIQVAERIQKELALPFKLNDHEVFTSASIGIALSSTGYSQPGHILRDADIAMYRAKTLGKARYEVFDTTMHNHAVVLLQLETDLRRAIKKKEFRIHYQPVVSLVTGRIVGFEALVRWQHPERGLVFPMEFIPVAEETGMIVSIGKWVLHEACRQMQIWHAQFPTTPPLMVSVNLSGKQITQPNLSKQINQVLQETGFDPSSLKLEITESVIIDNTESATAMLLQLRALNIELQMDDFGTGYSSLSYLHRLPINTLKIDRSFISNIGNNGENLVIVQAIVTLAHNLKMDVTAEGIETVEKLDQLRLLQCDRGQGYFFSKPLDSRRVEELLASKPQW